jgi:hypothetical protein
VGANLPGAYLGVGADFFAVLFEALALARCHDAGANVRGNVGSDEIVLTQQGIRAQGSLSQNRRGARKLLSRRTNATSVWKSA